MPLIFIPKESVVGEKRVAAVPLTVKHLKSLGYSVMVQKSAGSGSYITDESYVKEGAEMVDSAAAGYECADIVLKVNPPTASEAALLKAGSSLISFIRSHENPDLLDSLISRDIDVFAVESIPRISRAQIHDALSSQANLAGYKAVLLAANECPRIFPMLMTAAGTIRPAKVVILGAGVAGLQAIATAKRLGAVVEVSDVRPAVKEQVKSLGASFIEVPLDPSMETEGGYAKEATPEFLKRQAEETRKCLVKANAVICSALVFGRKAPVLISEDVVKEMQPGSVIVDMAADQGGNCALTVPGEIVECYGVKIIGTLNLPATVSANASELYAKNLFQVVKDCIKVENGKANWKMDDEIVAKALTPAKEMQSQFCVA